jgi:hypothetical protein
MVEFEISAEKTDTPPQSSPELPEIVDLSITAPLKSDPQTAQTLLSSMVLSIRFRPVSKWPSREWR